MGRRRRIGGSSYGYGDPTPEAGSGRKIHHSVTREGVGRDAGPEAAESTLPGKSSKESFRCPYLKPTQVDEMSIHRRARERSLRN